MTMTTITQILSSIARTGTKANALPTSSSSCSASEAIAADWSPVSAAHQQDVGVVLPMLAPGLGLPTGCSGGSGDSIRIEGKTPPRLQAMNALANFSWPAPPSLCHSGTNTAAAGVVHAMACLGEAEGQAALISALEKWVELGLVVHHCNAGRGRGAGLRRRGELFSLCVLDANNPRWYAGANALFVQHCLNLQLHLQRLLYSTPTPLPQVSLSAAVLTASIYSHNKFIKVCF